MQEKLRKELKKYKLNELLFSLAELSREIYLNDDFCKIVQWHQPRFGGIQKFEQMIPAWVLADLSYMAIINSNDHRSQSPTFEDICQLANLAARVSDDLAAQRKKRLPMKI